MKKTETVKVAIRVRPLNSKEKKENSQIITEVDSANNQINITKPETNELKSFQYDYVYDSNSTQRTVYNETAFPLIENVLEGYNGTIFAYGQTGCGKTFTMMGDPNSSEMKGIIPNAFDHIFGFINTEGGNKTFLVSCSFLEIYNEEIRDLLGKDPTKKLEIRENPKSGIFVKDLNIIQVKNIPEIQNYLNLGHVGETLMNAESSRSHCIFTVYVEIGENLNDVKNKKIKAGKLNLVDLAGSERQSKTGATGARLAEGNKINLSLTALSNVINALSEGKNHVPYRDSKLTRLLQDSLGGNTKTVMIAAVSPASYNYDETLSTLRYAARANTIKNAPKVNEDPKDALLRQYEEQIKLLKMQIEQGGVVTSPSNNNKALPNPNNYVNESNLRDELNLKHEAEKAQLMQKIKEMESAMKNNSIKGSDNKDDKNFIEYREKQKKINEDIDHKHKDLENRKLEEENQLFNDNFKNYNNIENELQEKNRIITKLRNKLKNLESEIKDLRDENDNKAIDLVSEIKDLNKENQLYKGIIRFLLSEGELKKIIELSNYNEDNDKWFIQPFSFRDRDLKLPNIKKHQINDFIENEHNNREVIFKNYEETPKMNKTRQNKFMASMNNNNNLPTTNNLNTLASNSGPYNHQQMNNNTNNLNSYNLKETKLNFFKSGYANKQQLNNNTENHNERQKIIPKGIQLDPLKKSPINQNIKINLKDAKKYQEMINNNRMDNNAPPPKNGKIILDPIVIKDKENGSSVQTNVSVSNTNNQYNQSKNNFFNKKMEVSFKATLKFSDENGNNGTTVEINPNFNVKNRQILKPMN